MGTQASWLVGVFGVIIAIIFGIKSRQADGLGERGGSMGEIEGRNYLQHGKEEVRRGVEIPRSGTEEGLPSLEAQHANPNLIILKPKALKPPKPQPPSRFDPNQLEE
eukprot:1378946-Amorphochlora_amoeboformis.AAC.1